MKFLLAAILFMIALSFGDSVAKPDPEDNFPVSITLSGISQEAQEKLSEILQPDEPWYSKYQTGLTGLAAIIAAIVALIGVRQQVGAVFKIEHAKEEKNIAAISAAFWSEMHHIQQNIQAQINIINHFLRREHVELNAIQLLPIETPIYDSLKGEIGKLPSEVTFAIVGTYALIRHYSMRMTKTVPDRNIYEIDARAPTKTNQIQLQKIKCVDKVYLQSLAMQLTAILQNLNLSSAELASIAKVDPKIIAALAENARKRQDEVENSIGN